MIDVEPTLQDEFFHVTIAQGIAQIPADPTQDDLRLEVTPCERDELVIGGLRRSGFNAA
jgi:hypothetical protein